MSDNDAPPVNPDELDVSDDERVAEIDEGRYVVSTGDGPPNVGRDRREEREPARESGFNQATAKARPDDRERRDPEPAPAANTTQRSSGGGSEVSAGDVSRWLSQSFDDDGFQYGFDATLHAEGDTTRHRMVSNDVTATFDTLVSWFAMNAGREAPPAEALGLLLVAADSPIQFPEGTLKRVVAQHGLSPDDSIGELLGAIEREGGMRIDG